MQEELTIERLAGALGEGDATETETTGRGKLRRLRAALKWLDHQFMYGHTDLCCFIFAVSIVGSLAGAAYGSLAVWNHNGRVQAVERAKKMDGEVFTVKDVSSNLVGDTRLFLQNSRGEDCGWVMIYMSNPLNEEVNPPLYSLRQKEGTVPHEGQDALPRAAARPPRREDRREIHRLVPRFREARLRSLVGFDRPVVSDLKRGWARSRRMSKRVRPRPFSAGGTMLKTTAAGKRHAPTHVTILSKAGTLALITFTVASDGARITSSDPRQPKPKSCRFKPRSPPSPPTRGRWRRRCAGGWQIAYSGPVLRG